MRTPPVLITVVGIPGDVQRARITSLLSTVLAEHNLIVHHSTNTSAELRYAASVRDVPLEGEPYRVLLDVTAPSGDPPTVKLTPPATAAAEEHKQNQKVGLIGCGMLLAFILLVLLILAFASHNSPQ